MTNEVKDYCVCCGDYVPEGTQICAKCRYEYMKEKKDSDLKEEVSDIINIMRNAKDNNNL